MAKVRLTKNELKKQKDSLKMYRRYLPTLILKKQQLQVEIQKVEERIAEVQDKKEKLENNIKKWVAVFGEEVGLDETFPVLEEVKTSEGNIAGVSIPLFEGAVFAPTTYDLWLMPLWIDRAVKELQKVILLDLQLGILNEQRKRLARELRTTSQRVNLFEKIKIPETQSHIKKIGIYLGDQQTAAVVRGKISKRGLERAAS